MLLLSTRSFTIDGVTVFPDHADRNQFWYLPGPVTLAKLPDSDEPQFTLIMYAPDLASSGVKGVGFLNVTLALTASDGTLQEIRQELKKQFDVDTPRLAPVPFDEGTVQIVALDMQGSGGATNAAPPGAFVGVQSVLGASSPELFGDNNALFALTLSEEGATILKAAFENGLAPVGAIYNLKFTGVRPALNVKITADLKRVYESFSVGLTAEVYWISAGIDATFEKLRQDGAIKVEIVNLAGDADNATAEQQAVALFKDQILSQWFTPSLSPTTAQAADVGVPTLPQQAAAANVAGAAGHAGAAMGGGAMGGGAMGGGAMGGGGLKGAIGGAVSGAMAGAMGGAQPNVPAAGGAMSGGGAMGGGGMAGAGSSGVQPNAGRPAVAAGAPGMAGNAMNNAAQPRPQAAGSNGAGTAPGAMGGMGGMSSPSGVPSPGGMNAGAQNPSGGAMANPAVPSAGAAQPQPGGGMAAGAPAGGNMQNQPRPAPPAGGGMPAAGSAGTMPGGGGMPMGGGGAQLPAAAAGAASAASPFGVALRLRFVHQDEQKTVTYEYSRMDAVQRTYAPQGYFGLLLNNVDRAKHFLQVDGTDPFFNRFGVRIDPPHDFAAIGLQTAHVAIDYGDGQSTASGKHGEFVFDAQQTDARDWQIFQGFVHSTHYSYTVDYTFDPEAGWAGEKSRYALPAVITENRQLTLDPHDVLGFLNVTVAPGHIDANLVDHIDVALHYEAKSGWKSNTVFTVRADTAPQNWKLRLSDKSNNTYSYTTKCTLKDGSVFNAGPIVSTASAIVVNDPFAGAINLTIQPVIDPAKTKLAIVEIAYRDPACDYDFETTLQVPPNGQPQRVHIPVVDRAKNAYQYRITTISTANQRAQGNYLVAQDPLVLVGDAP
jgi:hypothetical protein